MKKGLILVTTLCLSWLLLAAQVDIVGTWVGETEIPDFEDPDKITVVIKEEDGKFTGTATDTFGMMQDAECENIELEGTKLTMNLEIVNPDGEYIRVWATLTVEGDTMKGYWQSEDGDSNAIELKKQ